MTNPFENAPLLPPTDKEIFEKAGFTVEPMGGGTTAWQKVTQHGYVLITDSDGTGHELTDHHTVHVDRPDCWFIGLYDQRGHHVGEYEEAATAPEAIAQAAVLEALQDVERSNRV